MSMRKLAGWVMAGALASAVVAGGALAGSAQKPDGTGPGAGARPGAGGVLRQIQQARPQLTEAQWQQWLAATEQILADAVKDGKLTREQADNIRTHMADLKAGKLPAGRLGGWGHGFRHGGKPGHFGRDRSPEGQQKLLEHRKAMLEQAVRDGKLTREQADQMLQKMTEKIQQRKGQ